MADLSTAPRASSSSANCWNSIGVRGDGSCPELAHHIYCHNCPVYSDAAVRLLDAEASSDYIAAASIHFAKPQVVAPRNTRSAVVVRVEAEWLALTTQAVVAVANLRAIHSLPQRRKSVMGVVNVHGELLVCVSLAQIIGVGAKAPSSNERLRGEHGRLLVIRRDDLRAVCLVDEVSGIHRFQPEDLIDAPSTVSRAVGTYSKKVIQWQQRAVGLLDDQFLFYSLKRSLA